MSDSTATKVSERLYSALRPAAKLLVDAFYRGNDEGKDAFKVGAKAAFDASAALLEKLPGALQSIREGHAAKEDSKVDLGQLGKWLQHILHYKPANAND